MTKNWHRISSISLFHKALIFHLKKVAVVQELQVKGVARRLAFAETMWGIINEDQVLIMLTLDEAHFHLNGCVYKILRHC